MPSDIEDGVLRAAVEAVYEQALEAFAPTLLPNAKDPNNRVDFVQWYASHLSRIVEIAHPLLHPDKPFPYPLDEHPHFRPRRHPPQAPAASAAQGQLSLDRAQER